MPRTLSSSGLRRSLEGVRRLTVLNFFLSFRPRLPTSQFVAIHRSVGLTTLGSLFRPFSVLRRVVVVVVVPVLDQVAVGQRQRESGTSRWGLTWGGRPTFSTIVSCRPSYCLHSHPSPMLRDRSLVKGFYVSKEHCNRSSRCKNQVRCLFWYNSTYGNTGGGSWVLEEPPLGSTRVTSKDRDA